MSYDYDAVSAGLRERVHEAYGGHISQQDRCGGRGWRECRYIVAALDAYRDFERARAAVEQTMRYAPLCGDGVSGPDAGWCTDNGADGLCQIHGARRDARAELDRLTVSAKEPTP